MLHIDNGVDDNRLAFLPLDDAECFIEPEFSHTEFPVEIHHMVLELPCIRRFLQLYCQVYNPVSDPAVKYTAVLPGRFIVFHQGPQSGGFQVSYIVIKQGLEDPAVLPGQLIQGTARRSCYLTCGSVCIFIVCQTEGQETMPEVSLKSVLNSQLRQSSAAGRTVRLLPSLCVSHQMGYITKQLLVLQVSIYY